MLSRLSSSACVLRCAPRAARSLVTVSAFSQLPVSAISGTVGRSFSSNSYKQQQQQQQYTSASSWVLPILTATALGACILNEEHNSRTLAANAEPDYAAVKRAIADTLDDENYDDGSRGPVLVRLAWHAAGTFDKSSSSGGSNGATMRFPPESSDGANAGLDKARAFLEPIKKKFPSISYADLWTLAGVVAIEEMGGPKVPWRPGRTDAVDGKAAPPNGRLPDASKRQDHIRQVFYRMGFNDQEIVALVGGGHAIGRCHKDRSGYVGPWTNSPTTFSNEFFRILLEEKWTLHNKQGPNKSQYEDKSKQLMMLPADMALIEDKNFKVWVDLYAKDNDKFFKDFSAAFSKLLELGVKFPKDAKYV